MARQQLKDIEKERKFVYWYRYLLFFLLVDFRKNVCCKQTKAGARTPDCSKMTPFAIIAKQPYAKFAGGRA